MGETVQKHLDKANSVWHESSVTFGGPCRRTMISRMLRYLVVTGLCSVTQEHCLNQHSHTRWNVSLKWKEFAPQRANGCAQSQSQAPRGRGEQSWD